MTESEEIAKLRAEIEILKARDEVRSGRWCNGNLAEGRGPCGICPKCSRTNFERAETTSLQMDGLKEFLREIEWSGNHEENRCPWCANKKDEGHNQTCPFTFHLK